MFEDHIFEITFEFNQGRAYKYEAASCCGLQPGMPLYSLDIPLSVRFFMCHEYDINRTPHGN